MPSFPQFSIRQPQPFDLVDDPVMICGVGTGFEGVFSARVRDSNGTELAEQSIMAGGTGTWANFSASLPLSGTPATPQGHVEVFEYSAKGDGTIIGLVVVPVVFGVALLNPYHGFAQYTVVTGDTLSGIASTWYGNGALWPRIFEANRDQIVNPNLIYPGETLRIPQ